MCVNVCRYVRGFTWEESRDGQKGKGMRGELFFSFLPFQQSQFSQWVKWISWGQKIEAVCQLRPTQCITLCVCLCVLWMSHLSVVNSAVCWPAQREVRDGITPWVALCQWACPCLLLCVPESGSDHTSTSFFIYCTCAHQNNELAVNVTDCHLLEGVIGQNILSCHIRWFERWFPNQFNHLRSTSDGAEQHHEANSLWDWTHTRSFSNWTTIIFYLLTFKGWSVWCVKLMHYLWSPTVCVESAGFWLHKKGSCGNSTSVDVMGMHLSSAGWW